MSSPAASAATRRSSGRWAPDADGFTQHYFDSRGVVRLYAMTLEGRWETGSGDGGWELDFGLNYMRA